MERNSSRAQTAFVTTGIPFGRAQPYNQKKKTRSKITFRLLLKHQIFLMQFTKSSHIMLILLPVNNQTYVGSF